jgi:hypothetical protein
MAHRHRDVERLDPARSIGGEKHDVKARRPVGRMIDLA